MKTVSRLSDLEQFGIIPLTGEACPLGMRCLCDLTEQGVRLVCEYFSFNRAGLAENWNSEGVASIMLGYDDFWGLGATALILIGCHQVVKTSHGLFGFETDDQIQWTEEKGYEYSRDRGCTWMNWPQSCYGKIDRQYRGFSDHPREG